jgi:hypothetical protein
MAKITIAIEEGEVSRVDGLAGDVYVEVRNYDGGSSALYQGNLLRFFAWNLGALLPCFRQTNRDCLLPALHLAAMAVLAPPQRAMLSAAHR